jgi:hypothetical protein
MDRQIQLVRRRRLNVFQQVCAFISSRDRDRDKDRKVEIEMIFARFSVNYLRILFFIINSLGKRFYIRLKQNLNLRYNFFKIHA